MSAKEDLEKMRDRLEQAAAETAPDTELTFRAMFGGMGGYAGGRIFASLFDGGMGLKLPAGQQEELLKIPGAARVQYEPSMPPSNHYIAVPSAWLDDADALAPWVEKSIRYVLTLPVPAKKSAARKGKPNAK